MMDNLLAEGKAVPMVIAIPNNQVVHRSHPRHVELTFKLFEAELRKHVIPAGRAGVQRPRRSEGPRPLGPVHGRAPHDVRRLQFPGPVRLVRGAQRRRRRQREVDREVPQRSERQPEDRLPVRGAGHGGRRGPAGRPLRGTASGPREPQDHPRVLCGRIRWPRLVHLASLALLPVFCRTSGGRTSAEACLSLSRPHPAPGLRDAGDAAERQAR